MSVVSLGSGPGWLQMVPVVGSLPVHGWPEINHGHLRVAVDRGDRGVKLLLRKTCGDWHSIG